MTTVDDWNWDEVVPADELSLADEIRGMAEVRMSKKTGRTEEEIKQFSVDDDLSDTDKYLYIHNVKLEPLAVQREVGLAIEEIISRLPAQKVNQVLEIANVLLKYKNEEVSKVWKDVLISCINKLPSEEVRIKILPDTIGDLNLGQPAQFRIWTGRLLGTIICRLDPKKIDQIVLQKFINLCEDTDYEVRKSMCFHLNPVIKALGSSITKKHIFPVYLELLKDEEITVQAAAITNYTNYGEFMDLDQRVNNYIPYWKKIVEENNPKLVKTISELFGIFIWSAKDELKESDKKYFVSYYQTLSASSDENIRQNCAYNYPAIVKAMKPALFESFKLEKLLASFVHDESEKISITFASFFHEVHNTNKLTDMLGSNCYRILKELFPRLVLSKNKLVYTPVFKNIEKILNNFGRDPTFKQGNNTESILKLILEKRKSFDNTPNIDWRTHLFVLDSFNALISIIDSETLYEQHSPLLFKLITDNFPENGNPRKSAQTIPGYFLINLDVKEDQNCHIRILFFDVCERILEQFSGKFFREYFLTSYFALSRDPIPNIRLKYVALLPMVRHIIRLPTDSLLLSKLIDATEPLATRDSDNEVMAAMNRFYAQHGLLNQESCCQKPANVAQAFGLEAFGNERMKTLNSNESITDPYLFSAYKWESMDTPEKDLQKEEYESKYFVNLTIKKKELVKKITTGSTRKIEPSSSKMKISTTKKPELPPIKPPTPKAPSFKKDTPPAQLKKEEVKSMEVDIKKVSDLLT
ncbi:Serine/threonine-protein phosphatase 4 regulatory subunit 4 [Terramyces sp. JEL0728]|nr:Serine/threonine-protein phosphatase 4 regulatory subunit 4 [Terramyces sp. JEL0728]